MYIPGQICNKCKQEIGHEKYVFMVDKISKGMHKFHVRCAPVVKDVQKHYGVTIERGVFGLGGRNIGSV